MRRFSRTDPDQLSFQRDEDGSATVWSLFLLASMAMLAGLAVDVSNATAARTNLQLVADVAAHAALLKRELGSVSDAKNAALATASKNRPVDTYGVTVRGSDIVFGVWDAENGSFTPDTASRSAVKVTARQTTATENPLGVFFLQFVGVDRWEVVTEATFVTYQPTCLKEGFVAEQEVDIQSNNSFHNGFCIHSNSYVSLNSNNYFEPGTVVSMPSLDDIELPNSGYKTNIGLQDALREGSWNIRIIERISEIIQGLGSFNDRYLPDYILASVARTLPSTTVKQADVEPGKLYTYNCAGNKSLTIDKDVILSQVVIVTNCQVKFSAGVALEDAIIATTHTGAKSLNAPSGLRLGRNDNCAAGGGAQLVTMGSVEVASGLEMFGSQIIAQNDIQFAANANGIKGAAIVAGGVISGTSNMAMGYCGAGMEDNFHAEYFKLVK
jgi:Flp pilus assembly protein TadG